MVADAETCRMNGFTHMCGVLTIVNRYCIVHLALSSA